MLVLGAVTLLVCLGPVWGQVVLTQCPSGWVTNSNYCYKFKNNATSKITWAQANDECHRRHSDLLRIETVDEYNWVTNMLTTYPSDAYWTALNNLPLHQGANLRPWMKPSAKPAFMWGDDEYPIDDVVGNHWDTEPDNIESKDCVQINTQGAMTVEDCANRHAYVCEVNKNDPAEACPVGIPNLTWQASGTLNTCYYVSNASQWSSTLDWDTARRTCETLAPFNDNRKAQLLTITTAAVQAMVATAVSGLYRTRQVFWTGLNDQATEGTFVWRTASGTSLPFNVQFITWRKEPNNLGGNEHCGGLLPGGRWMDSGCQDKKNYICRLPLNTAGIYNFGCGQWSRAGSQCVYIFHKPKKTWSGARAFCQAENADLMKFSSEDDVMWLKTQTDLMTLPTYYIGLNDQANEDTFVWADGTFAPGQLLDWDTEPNNNGLGRFQENCAYMSVEGFFMSSKCRGVSAGTICEVRSGTCKPTWLKKAQSCYLISPDWREVSEARDFCHDQSVNGDGKLLILNDQTEKDFILSHLATLQDAPYTWWSDLTKRWPDNTWHWSDPNQDNFQTVHDLVTWNFEPNDWQNNEDCVVVDSYGHLNDVNCNMRSGFICQRSVGGASGLTPSHLITAILSAGLLYLLP